MARHAAQDGPDLLIEVERLAGEGLRRAEIAGRLGFKNLSTFSGRLVRASQQSGNPVPVFRAGSKATARKRVDIVQVKPRGRDDSFGVNVPQEPLERLGAKPGDRLAVTVGRRRVVLAVASAGGEEGGHGFSRAAAGEGPQAPLRRAATACPAAADGIVRAQPGRGDSPGTRRRIMELRRPCLQALHSTAA
jgi:hypothetical protein